MDAQGGEEGLHPLILLGKDDFSFIYKWEPNWLLITFLQELQTVLFSIMKIMQMELFCEWIYMQSPSHATAWTELYPLNSFDLILS